MSFSLSAEPVSYVALCPAEAGDTPNHSVTVHFHSTRWSKRLIYRLSTLSAQSKTPALA